MERLKKRKNSLDKPTARLLDANLNRAREGLRVLEDTARFVWNKKSLYYQCRGLRHDLQKITEAHYHEFLSARESVFDVGRTVKEGARQSLQNLVSANVRRAQEATRVLEEYSKVFSPKAAPEIKRIRYSLYTLEKKVIKNGTKTT